MTPWQQHVEHWKDCTRCPLHAARVKVVLCRGKLPCDALFVGEGPGESEDVIGLPFVGPAGKLLDFIIGRSLPEEASYALTNVVACIPRDGDGRKSGAPVPEEIEECRPRLLELIKLARPKLIVCVGAVARGQFDPKMYRSLKKSDYEVGVRGVTVPVVDVQHPAAILRMNPAHQEMAIRRAEVTIRNAAIDFKLDKDRLIPY